MMPFDMSCDLLAYGRPAMILSAVTSPTPGIFIRSAFDAVLMSHFSEPAAILPLAGFAGVAGVAAVAGAFVPADAGVAGAADVWVLVVALPAVLWLFVLLALPDAPN